MRLGLKFLLAFLLGNTLLAGVYGYLAVRREVRQFEQMVGDEALAVGPVMADVLPGAWSKAGQKGLERLIDKANRSRTGRLRIRWVWFEVVPGGPEAPWASWERLTTVTIQERLAVHQDVEPDGTQEMDVDWPVELGAGRGGWLKFSHPLTALELNEHAIIERTAWLVSGTIILSALLAAVLGRRYVGAPLQRLIAKTRRIAAGDLSGPVQLDSHDELAELAGSLNAMCAAVSQSQAKARDESAGRLAAVEQLRHADRLKTVGRLAAGLAHQLGTPLNVVSGRAGLIASGKLSADAVAQSTAAITAETDRMTTIVRQLLDFARASTPRKAPNDLRQVLGQTIEMLRSLAENQRVELGDADAGPPAMADVDAGQLQQALANLTINAIQSMPGGGKVDFTVERRMARPADNAADRAADRADDPAAAYYAIGIRDHGSGIAEEHLPQLFEPFFSTKAAGEGTGLGLSIAQGIVQEHGGRIEVASRPGEGSCFTVILPEGGKS